MHWVVGVGVGVGVLVLRLSSGIVAIPKKCLTLGLCLEYETFIRGVLCPNLCVFVCVFVGVGPLF